MSAASPPATAPGGRARLGDSDRWRREIMRLNKLITGREIWAGRSMTKRVVGADGKLSKVIRLNGDRARHLEAPCWVGRLDQLHAAAHISLVIRITHNPFRIWMPTAQARSGQLHNIEGE